MTEGRTPLLVAILLTWTAGFVDAVGFLSLGRIYTANMSGNSVSLGIATASQGWQEASVRLWVVLTYVAGLLFCRLLLGFSARRGIRYAASIAFLIEIGLLVPVALASAATAGTSAIIRYELIALLALAMGVQNGAITHFSSLTVHTGFVTGTLVMLGERLAQVVTWTFGQFRQRRRDVFAILKECSQRKESRIAAWLATVWVGYVCGAASGTFVHMRISLESLVIAISVLLALTVVDLWRPLAVRDEQEQIKAQT